MDIIYKTSVWRSRKTEQESMTRRAFKMPYETLLQEKNTGLASGKKIENKIKAY